MGRQAASSRILLGAENRDTGFSKLMDLRTHQGDTGRTYKQIETYYPITQAMTRAFT